MVKTIADAGTSRKPRAYPRVSAELRNTALALLKEHGAPALVARQMNGLLSKAQIVKIALKAARQLLYTPGLAPDFQDLLLRQTNLSAPPKPQKVPDDILVEALRLTQSVAATSGYFHRVSEARAATLAKTHKLPTRKFNTHEYRDARAALAGRFDKYGCRLPPPAPHP